MTSFHKAIVLSTAVVLAAPVGNLAAQPAKSGEVAAHHPASAASMPTPAQDARMRAMRDMRDRMAAAKTPEEQQALMAAHMKAMGEGMQMMKAMSGMGGMSGMGASGGKPMTGAKADAKGMPADMAKHHQMMEARMETMQTMMEMMMQRMPAMPVDGK